MTSWGLQRQLRGLQLLLTYVPPMQRLFQTASIGLEAWAAIIGVAVIVLFVVGAEKSIRNRWGARTKRSTSASS